MNDIAITLLNPDNTNLLRRLMAIIYDLFLLIAILFLATFIANIFNNGVAFDASHPYFIVYNIYLLLISFFYYGWFWTHGGQTLGMKTWKIKLQSKSGNTITWLQVLTRSGVAIVSWLCIGLGFIWSVFHPAKLCWHDIASKSLLVDLRFKESSNTTD